MRVVVANKFWYPRGGLERVMFDEIAWLEAAGHEIAHFSTQHPDNVASPFSDHFAPYLELGHAANLGVGMRLRAAANMFSNPEARERFAALIREFRPDVVHVHGIHRQLSPSILAAASQAGVPVVQTLHDFHHVCPADSLLYKGVEPCMPRRCGVLWYGSAVRGRCLRGSVTQSALSAAETSWARLRRSYELGLARFIAPSRFMADVMTDGGWAIPTDVIPNAVEVAARERGPIGSDAPIAVIGRIVPEKGVDCALDAARLAACTAVVAGDGPTRSLLETTHPEARFVGHVGKSEVDALLERCLAVVLPSRVLENAPMSVLEAMARGVPVIASAIGGIPELISDGVDGILVPPGDVDAIAASIERLKRDPDLARSLGSRARETISRRFTPQAHFDSLVQSYLSAVAQKRGGGRTDDRR